MTPPDESRWPPDDDHHDTRDGQGTPRYPDDRYPDDRYPDERYPDDRYPDRRYPDERYADGGYAGGQDGGRYAGGSYPDDGYAHDQRRDVGYDNGYPGGYPGDRHDGRRPEERYEGGARPDGRYDGGGYPANPESRYGDGGYDDRPYRDSPYPDDRYADDRYADAGEPHRPGSPFPHADEHPARYRPNVNRPAQDPPAPWGDPEPPSDRPPGPPPYEPARHEWDPRDGGPRHDRSRARYDDPPYDQPQHDQPQYDEPPYGDRRYDGRDEARYDGSRHGEPRYGEPRYDDSRYGTPGQPPPYEERPDRGGEPPAWYADGSHATARVPTDSAYPDTPPPVPGRRRSDPDDPYDAAPHPTAPRRAAPNAGMSPQSYQEGGAEIGRRPAGGRPPAGEQTRRLPSAPAVPPPSEGGPAMWSSRSRTPAPGTAPRAGAGSARRTRPPVEPLDGPRVEPLVEPLDEVAADDRTSRLAPPVTPPPASTRRPAAEGARPAGRRPATGKPATGKQGAGKQGTGAARGAATAKRGGLGRASGTMAIGTIASRASGFLRTVAIAAAIGTGAVGQAFNVANTTPNILYDLLLGGILTSVIVPVLVQASKEDPDGGDGFASSLITLMVLGLGAAVLVGMFAAPQIISLYLNTGPAQRELGADLLRWFMPQILFYGIGATLGAILNTRQSFAAPMFAPVLNNLVVIVTCLVFIFLPGPRPPTLGGITDAQKFVLAGGTTLGVVVMTIALLPSVRAVGFRYRPRLDLRHPGLRTSSRLAGWTLLYVLISQLGYVMITRLSSSTTAYSIYSYAYQIFQLPYAIIGVSVITALLPRMSGHAASEQADLVREDLSTASRMTVTAIVPSALFLLALGRPIAVTVFNHGAVDYDDAIAIGDTLSAFAIALVPFSLFQVQLRAFYAYRDSRTPALVNIGVVATNVLAAFVLSEVVAEKHRAAALALAFSLAYLIGLVATTVLLRRRLLGIDGNRIARVTTRVSVTAGVGAVLASVVADGLRDLLGRGWLGSGVAVVLALVVGGLAFVVISVRTGMHEMTALMRIVGGRLGVGRRTKPAGASASARTGTGAASASSTRPPRSAGRGDGGRGDGGRGRPPGGRGDRGGRGGPSGRPGGPPGRRGGSSGRRG